MTINNISFLAQSSSVATQLHFFPPYAVTRSVYKNLWMVKYGMKMELNLFDVH